MTTEINSSTRNARAGTKSEGAFLLSVTDVADPDLCLDLTTSAGRQRRRLVIRRRRKNASA